MFLSKNFGDLLGKFNHHWVIDTERFQCTFRLTAPLIGRRKWDLITSLRVSSPMSPLTVLKLTTLLAIILSYQTFQLEGT